VHCGRLSYCLYLVHMLVLDAWDVHVGPTLPHVAALDPFGRVVLRAAVVGGVSLAIAEASRRWLEEPALRLAPRATTG